MKNYQVDVRLNFELLSRLETEGDVQAGVRALIDELGFGGAMFVNATEVEGD